jgi:cell division protease FtsH
MSDNPQNAPGRPRGLAYIFMFFVIAVLLFLLVCKSITTANRSWGFLLDDIRLGHVTRVSVDQDSVAVTAKGSASAKEINYTVDYPGGMFSETAQRELHDAITDYNDHHRQDANQVAIDEKGVPARGMIYQLIPWIVVMTLFLLVMYFLVFRRMSQGGGVLSFGKSRAQLITKGKTGKTFRDVAGIDEAREEVEELVAFLKNPKKFQKLGGRIPRGVLLVGPPGTGKTLLAKAIAGEADVPFYSISGSDFVEMFVGVGASRVRDLFSQAKDNSPCIIFIDEIDAVGRRRGTGMNSGGHDEREQTLNAILVEMDGFSSTDKVIVIAATNRVDVLDPALLRPGRFDRHIHVSLPDIAGREQILNVHAAKVKIGAGVDLTLIARGTPGFSGADLESLINEAALNAARHEQDAVMQRDLEWARDRVAFGREKKTGSRAMPERERVMTAYHESGHALLQTLVDEADELHKVTIIPRGRALGATMYLPSDDRHTHGRRKLLGEIATLFGGRIAEDMFCNEITTGASDDIRRATNLARGMVYEWGMSEKMGPIKYTEEHDSMLGTESVVSVSAVTRRELDEEVRVIIDQQYALAKRLLEANRDALERVAKALLEYETLDGAQVRTLLAGGELPPRKPSIPPRPPENPPAKEPVKEPPKPIIGGGDLKPHLA